MTFIQWLAIYLGASHLFALLFGLAIIDRESRRGFVASLGMAIAWPLTVVVVFAGATVLAVRSRLEDRRREKSAQRGTP